LLLQQQLLMGAFRKTLLFVGGGVFAVGAIGAAIIGTSSSAAPFARVDYKEGSNNGKYAVRLPPLETVPPRQKQLESLRSTSQEENPLDILVIGGGKNLLFLIVFFKHAIRSNWFWSCSGCCTPWTFRWSS